MIADLTPDECRKILVESHYAHLGCMDGDHEVHVLPITYVYEGGFLYSYTHEGEKIDLMRAYPKICIQVEDVSDAMRWSSVCCWGKFEEVKDAHVIQNVKLLLAEAHGLSVLHGRMEEVSPAIEDLSAHGKKLLDNSVIYRMKPYKMTGKVSK